MLTLRQVAAFFTGLNKLFRIKTRQATSVMSAATYQLMVKRLIAIGHSTGSCRSIITNK